ncbi:MAG: GntR family transcriptional regulator [Chloroflexi bacterium]|nr:MAG: GntR family transcriptional regulator [Chloroflexota bacterium]
MCTPTTAASRHSACLDCTRPAPSPDAGWQRVGPGWANPLDSAAWAQIICLQVYMQTSPWPADGLAPLLPLAGPAPLYYRLQQAVRDRIAAGEWCPGDQIPTIREFGETYGVSRITVVQALHGLAREGLLTRRQGKGVFVAEPKIEQGPIRLLSFTDDITRRGHRPSTRMLDVRRERASPELASRLELLVPGLADTQPIESLYRLLRDRYSIVPARATETFEPIVLDRETARLLSVAPGSPAFAVERITRDRANRAFEFVKSTMRGDRYKVVLELVAP